MRAVYITPENSVGVPRRRHKFAFGPERSTPSGIEAKVYLEGAYIGVLRGIDMTGPRGGQVRTYEVQLESRLLAHGRTVPRVLRRILPDALRHLDEGRELSGTG